MQPEEISRASDLIFTFFTEFEHVPKKAVPRKLTELLRGEKGRGVQQVLFEISIALERHSSALVISNLLSETISSIHFHCFRMLDSHGMAARAPQVLSDRLTGPDGIARQSSREFIEIKVNVGHISREQTEEQELYWRKRIKTFKYNLIKELEYYVEAAKSAVGSASEIFNSSASHIMNKILDNMRRAERQQEVLIKLRSSAIDVNLFDLYSVNENELAEFLSEAIVYVSKDEFRSRLEGIIRQSLKLSAFENLYKDLQNSSSKEWNDLRVQAENFRENIGTDLSDCRNTIEELIDTINYPALPEEFDIDAIAGPFASTTVTAIDKLQLCMDAWIKILGQKRHEIEEAIQNRSR